MADKQNEVSRELIEKANEENPKDSREISTLTIKVDVEVSEALTGLKALQREAKEATKALRELEAMQHSMTITVAIDGRILTTPSLMNKSITVAPLTVGNVNVDDIKRSFERLKTIYEIPEHVKKYGSSEGWSGKSDSAPRVWFDESVSTRDLTDELVKRAGITEYVVNAHGGRAILSIDNGSEGANIPIDGPARIIVNRD